MNAACRSRRQACSNLRGLWASLGCVREPVHRGTRRARSLRSVGCAGLRWSAQAPDGCLVRGAKRRLPRHGIFLPHLTTTKNGLSRGGGAQVHQPMSQPGQCTPSRSAAPKPRSHGPHASSGPANSCPACRATKRARVTVTIDHRSNMQALSGQRASMRMPRTGLRGNGRPRASLGHGAQSPGITVHRIGSVMATPGRGRSSGSG